MIEKKNNLYSSKLNLICYADVFDIESQSKVRTALGINFF